MQTWRSSCGTYRVVLASQFLDESSCLAGEYYPNEVGTSLVGTYSDDGWDATVVEVAPLTPDSTGGSSWFMRGMRGLRSYFVGLFKKSGGLSHYVGEWHSHPDGTPIPSPTDDRNMMDIAADPEARCPECILVLVAFNAAGAETAVYVYSKARGRVALERVESDVASAGSSP